MKKIIALVAVLGLLFSLSACGKKTEETSQIQSEPEVQQENPGIVEVKLNMANFLDYFEYEEYKSPAKDDNGKTYSMQILYGFKLKDGYTAAARGDYPDTLQVNFTAVGVINTGSFTVDFDTLEYTGQITDTEYQDISEDLVFWAKGNRTEIWAFGNYNSSYIMYLQNFTVTAVSGSIYLQN